MGAFNDPLVLMILAGIGGWALSEWRRGQDGQSKAIQVDANILARLATVETWQRDHNSIHGCVQRLAATTEAMAKNMDRLTKRIDIWMEHFPPAPPARRARAPYDFPSARDWILEDESK